MDPELNITENSKSASRRPSRIIRRFCEILGQATAVADRLGKPGWGMIQNAPLEPIISG